MNSKFYNFYCYSFFIALLFLIFGVLSHISLPGRAFGESGYIEAFQVILIVSVLVVGIVRKSYLINAYSRTTYLLRQSFFSFLFFEEISYLTMGKLNFLNYNEQSELNFHNSRFLTDSLFDLFLLGDDAIHFHPKLIISLFVIVFLFAGARIPFLKRFSIISLHPLVCIGILFYPINYGFSYLIRNLLHLNSFILVNVEFVELLMYIIFLMDIVIKTCPRLSANSCN